MVESRWGQQQCNHLGPASGPVSPGPPPGHLHNNWGLAPGPSHQHRSHQRTGANNTVTSHNQPAHWGHLTTRVTVTGAHHTHWSGVNTGTKKWAQPQSPRSLTRGHHHTVTGTKYQWSAHQSLAGTINGIISIRSTL